MCWRIQTCSLPTDKVDLTALAELLATDRFACEPHLKGGVNVTMQELYEAAVDKRSGTRARDLPAVLQTTWEKVAKDRAPLPAKPTHPSSSTWLPEHSQSIMWE